MSTIQGKTDGTTWYLVFIIEINTSRSVEGGMQFSRGENSDRVEQSDNTQLHFPWDEEVQRRKGKDNSQTGIELIHALILII